MICVRSVKESGLGKELQRVHNVNIFVRERFQFTGYETGSGNRERSRYIGFDRF